MKEQRLARQGDVFLIYHGNKKIDGKEVPPVKGKGLVLAYGEVTGHAHAIRDYKDVARMLEAENGTRYLEITETAKLIHEEHSTIPLDPGMWEIRNQQEYNWQEKAFENVRD